MTSDVDDVMRSCWKINIIKLGERKER